MSKLLAAVDALTHEVPYIQRLQHRGIRKRHWTQVQETVGYDIRPTLVCHTLC